MTYESFVSIQQKKKGKYFKFSLQLIGQCPPIINTDLYKSNIDIWVMIAT